MIGASRIFLGVLVKKEIREEASVSFKIVLTFYNTSLISISFGAGKKVKSLRLGNQKG